MTNLASRGLGPRSPGGVPPRPAGSGHSSPRPAFPAGARAVRGLLATLVLAGAALPAIADTTIRAVMHSDLRVIDPIITTAYITRDHGYMVYDTLFALDENFEVQPQMADVSVSDDKLVYTFTLRDGLKFHDGSSVKAEDAVASIERWAERDGMGQKLMDFVKSLEAKDDATMVLTLSEPYGLVLESLGKPSSVVPFIMPKRLAETPSTEAIPEQIGSGPFRFVADEFQPGVRAVYEKFEDYVPRDEAPSWGAGGKVVKVDRVEWITMPDPQTAMNAMMSGEIDYYEQPPTDLLPILQANDELEVRNLNELGFQTIMRLNFLYPPFDDPRMRRAAMLAMNQQNVLDALVGNPEYYEKCGAMFVCGTPLATEVGSEDVVNGTGMEKARALLKEAGYDGTPVLLMQTTDVTSLKAQPIVGAQALRDAGFVVDSQAMDWQTVVTRRASQAPPAKGGWNVFFTNWVGADVMNPLVNLPLIGRGEDGGWFGWPKNDEIEKLRDQYARSASESDQKEIAAKIQELAYENVMYVPLGQYVTPTAWSKSLDGVLDGPVPYFWNISKKEE